MLIQPKREIFLRCSLLECADEKSSRGDVSFVGRTLMSSYQH
jgi:hypothetical protein